MVGVTSRSTGCIPESGGFVTSRFCDQSIVMTIVTYLLCAMAKAAVMLGSTSIFWLQKSRAEWSLCSSCVCVATA